MRRQLDDFLSDGMRSNTGINSARNGAMYVMKTDKKNQENTTKHHDIGLDGGEILHQLIGGKHPIIYRVSTIGGLSDFAGP